MRHLQRKESPQRITKEIIWSVWLKLTNLRYVVSSHVLKASERVRLDVQTLRLQAIDRLVRTEVTNERSINKAMRAACVHTIKRRPRAFGLNCDHRRPLGRPTFLAQQIGQTCDRSNLKERKIGRASCRERV